MWLATDKDTGQKNSAQPVLVADDQILNREFFAVILEKLGYDYVIAIDGKDALEKAQSVNPSIIFMDLQMPVMDGYEASRKIRELKPEIPIIAVTAGILTEEQDLCLDAGINNILIKPLKRADVEKELNKWLKSGGATKPQDSTSNRNRTVFDTVYFLDAFMNNEEVALPLLCRFLERTKSQLAHFHTLEKAGEWDSVRSEVHMIRGASMTIGGFELGQVAANLESAAKSAIAVEASAIYIELCDAFARFNKEAEAFLLSKKGNSYGTDVYPYTYEFL